MTVFAHAGHWLANLAYAAPVLVLVGWMGVTKVKDVRARRRGGVGSERLGAQSD